MSPAVSSLCKGCTAKPLDADISKSQASAEEEVSDGSWVNLSAENSMHVSLGQDCIQMLRRSPRWTSNYQRHSTAQRLKAKADCMRPGLLASPSFRFLGKASIVTTCHVMLACRCCPAATAGCRPLSITCSSGFEGMVRFLVAWVGRQQETVTKGLYCRMGWIVCRCYNAAIAGRRPLSIRSACQIGGLTKYS